MAVGITRRIKLVVNTQGIVVNGDGFVKPALAPWTNGANLARLSRLGLTKAVEEHLSRISSAAFKAGTRPMNWQVEIQAPQRLDYGFQRYGLSITWPAPAQKDHKPGPDEPLGVAPNPRATQARRARKAKAA